MPDTLFTVQAIFEINVFFSLLLCRLLFYIFSHP